MQMSETKIDVRSELGDALEGIEGKLRERGKIVSMCGDEEADSSLYFVYKEDEGAYLRVDVNTKEGVSSNEEVAEEISDYVTSKIYDCFGEGSFDIEDEFMGVEVYVNGVMVY